MGKSKFVINVPQLHLVSASATWTGVRIVVRAHRFGRGAGMRASIRSLCHWRYGEHLLGPGMIQNRYRWARARSEHVTDNACERHGWGRQIDRCRQAASHLPG